MNSHTNISLLSYNTFGIDVQAKQVLECENDADILEAIRLTQGKKKFVIGGGSNVLFMNDFDGTIIRPTNCDFEVVEEDSESVLVRVGAGYEWDAFVERCVANGWQGVENLSAIPGTVGASPVQNIGAYGVEAKDAIESVEGFFCSSSEPFKMMAGECEFGYRSSIFKTKHKDNIIIAHVNFRLKKSLAAPNLNYGSVSDEVQKLGEATIANVRQAIINIRGSKLPDPKVEGNAGSFFKNPVVANEQAEDLKKAFPEMPTYNAEAGKTKLSAAWLIDKCGWKGRSIKNAGVHNKQALVLVNRGGATGEEVMNLATSIQADVQRTFGVTLEMEVNRIQ